MILRAICTAVVVVGDIAVFLAFVIFGNTEHEITFGQTLIRTALPFGFVWVIGGLWLGAYKASTLYDLGTTMWKIPLIWLLCGLTALVSRAVLTDASLILSWGPPWPRNFTPLEGRSHLGAPLALQGSILIDFWTEKIASIFESILGSIFERFWSHVGVILA